MPDKKVKEFNEIIGEFHNLFVWHEGKVEDVRFWCEPELTLKAIRKTLDEMKMFNGFVALEARGFYLSAIASTQYNLPSIMVRKHKTFFDAMDHETIQMTNWKGESESLTVLKNTLPSVNSVIVVDDILDTGASLKATMTLLSRLNIQVVGAMYLLNSYGEMASEDFGIPVKSILTKPLFQ